MEIIIRFKCLETQSAFARSLACSYIKDKSFLDSLYQLTSVIKNFSQTLLRLA